MPPRCTSAALPFTESESLLPEQDDRAPILPHDNDTTTEKGYPGLLHKKMQPERS